jgi:hypothetical protein
MKKLVLYVHSSLFGSHLAVDSILLLLGRGLGKKLWLIFVRVVCPRRTKICGFPSEAWV